MYTDKLLRVSDSQTVTIDAVSTDTIDLSVARDIGEGKELFMHFSVNETVTSGTGGSTVSFNVIGSAAADLSSAVVLGSSGPIVKTDLVAGKRIAVAINPQIASLGYRYLGAQYDVSATLTAGKFTADIVETVQDGQKFYASGFSVV
jgi:hypothetical protein